MTKEEEFRQLVIKEESHLDYTINDSFKHDAPNLTRAVFPQLPDTSIVELTHNALNIYACLNIPSDKCEELLKEHADCDHKWIPTIQKFKASRRSEVVEKLMNNFTKREIAYMLAESASTEQEMTKNFKRMVDHNEDYVFTRFKK